jgi:hypothetical protein
VPTFDYSPAILQNERFSLDFSNLEEEEEIESDDEMRRFGQASTDKPDGPSRQPIKSGVSVSRVAALLNSGKSFDENAKKTEEEPSSRPPSSRRTSAAAKWDDLFSKRTSERRDSYGNSEAISPPSNTGPTTHVSKIPISQYQANRSTGVSSHPPSGSEQPWRGFSGRASVVPPVVDDGKENQATIFVPPQSTRRPGPPALNINQPRVSSRTRKDRDLLLGTDTEEEELEDEEEVKPVPPLKIGGRTTPPRDLASPTTPRAIKQDAPAPLKSPFTPTPTPFDDDSKLISPSQTTVANLPSQPVVKATDSSSTNISRKSLPASTTTSNNPLTPAETIITKSLKEASVNNYPGVDPASSNLTITKEKEDSIGTSDSVPVTGNIADSSRLSKIEASDKPKEQIVSQMATQMTANDSNKLNIAPPKVLNQRSKPVIQTVAAQSIPQTPQPETSSATNKEPTRYVQTPSPTTQREIPNLSPEEQLPSRFSPSTYASTIKSTYTSPPPTPPQGFMASNFSSPIPIPDRSRTSYAPPASKIQAPIPTVSQDTQRLSSIKRKPPPAQKPPTSPPESPSDRTVVEQALKAQPFQNALNKDDGRPQSPLSPPRPQSADLIPRLESELSILALQRRRINRAIADLTAVLPPNPSTHNQMARSEMKTRLEDLRQELAGIQHEEHETGLRLHRAWRRKERNDMYGEPTTLWVRRVAGGVR